MLLLLSSWLIHVPITMRLCNSRLPEEHFGYYQTSQRNWVIIKVLYRCLRRYLVGWRISRLGFVTLIVGEVSLGPLGNAHHLSLASIAANELVAGWCIIERVKRLAGNKIEDFVPCPGGTFLGVEGKLGDMDMWISYHCNPNPLRCLYKPEGFSP